MINERPLVGIGVVIINTEGKVLLGKRKGSHAPYYSIPGGHLELGETFEEAACKEVLEETSLVLQNPKVISVSNNLETFKKEGKHYISVILLATNFSGTPKVMEEDKSEGWFWADPKALPQPHFDASEMAVACYLDDVFYLNSSIVK